MPSLGSVAEGQTSTELDLQAIQLNKFKLAEAPINLQREAVALKQDQMKLAQETKMYTLMQNIKPPNQVSGTDDLAGLLSQISVVQAEAGMPDAAAKTAGTASRLMEDSSKIAYRAYRLQTDRMSKFANILAATPDTPQGYMQAIQTMASIDPTVAQDPRFQALAKQPWTPGMVPKLERSVLSSKEQAEVDYRKKAGDHAEAAAKVDDKRVALIDAQRQLIEDRDKAVRKEGGSIVKADDRKAIYQMALRDYPGADDADLSVRVRPLAEEMVKMMHDNHISQSQAATRVYEAARTRGAFSGLRQSPVKPGTKPGLPLEVPKDPKRLQQNQWYNIKGEPKLLMGDQFFSEDELSEIDKEDEAEDNAEDLEEAQQ